jgi:hypothetical protein
LLSGGAVTALQDVVDDFAATNIRKTHKGTVES